MSDFHEIYQNIDLNMKSSNANRRSIGNVIDNGGRRSGIDRRQFTYSIHIPEAREGSDRRKNGDRRSDRPTRAAIYVTEETGAV